MLRENCAVIVSKEKTSRAIAMKDNQKTGQDAKPNSKDQLIG